MRQLLLAAFAGCAASVAIASDPLTDASAYNMAVPAVAFEASAPLDRLAGVTPAAHSQTEPLGSEPPCSDWSFFSGLEGSKQPQDFGVNAHFGARVAINHGRLLSTDRGLGVQVGTAIVATDNAVQVVERVEGSSSRLQSFTTLGLFQNSGPCHWSVVYDLLWQDYYDDFFLGQWRGQAGLDVDERNEAGVMAMLHGHGDDGVFGAVDVHLRPISQISGYWRHTWPAGGWVRGWLGLADGHAEANAALGDWPRRKTMVVFGSDLSVPLTNYLALTGQANFITPADTGTVDAFLGFEFFPGGRASSGRGARPLLPVASNATFSVDLFR